MTNTTPILPLDGSRRMAEISQETEARAHIISTIGRRSARGNWHEHPMG